MFTAVRRPLLAAALAVPLLAGATTATAVVAGAAPHAAPAPADRPVSRFVAWQACRAAVWQWAAENALEGTEVDTRGLRRYRASLAERERGGWLVHVAGDAHGDTPTVGRSASCLVKGTNAAPRITERELPR